MFVILVEHAGNSTGAGLRLCCHMNTVATFTTTKAAASAATPAMTAGLGERKTVLDFEVFGVSEEEEEVEIKLSEELEDCESAGASGARAVLLVEFAVASAETSEQEGTKKMLSLSTWRRLFWS